MHERLRRLTPAARQSDLAPWQRAEKLTRVFLYWIPVHSFPVPIPQRQWLLRFFDLLAEILKERHQLRTEVFLQYKTVVPLRIPFLKNSREFVPMMGMIRSPGAAISPILSQHDVDEMVEGRKKFNFDEFVSDYAYWFVHKDGKKQREQFWGHGGMIMISLKADAATIPPELSIPQAWREKLEVFKVFDVDRAVADACSLKDGFLKKSKELFGAGLENEAQFRGLSFVLPLLKSGDFFAQPAEECGKWFQLFDVYVNESPADGGVILATGPDFEDTLIEVLKKMQEEGLTYPEG